MTDKQLIKTCTQFRTGLLGRRKSYLMCFVVCAPLQGFLKLCGVHTQIIEKNYRGTYNHFWLQLSDGRIIDPTADQLIFPDGKPGPKVYLGEQPEFYDKELTFINN